MKLVLWAGGLVLLLLIGLTVAVRTMADDPVEWHVDPTTTERTGQPNDYLVAPPGISAASTDQSGPTSNLPPEELLFLFDAIARNAPRVSILVGSIDDGHVTYVQRSMVFGFPDYISVKAITLDDGMSALVIWSRSRIGYSDMGVNAARITEWLAKMSPQ